MKDRRNTMPIILLTASVLVFIVSVIFLIIGDFLADNINVIGIRVATLFVAFAAFISSSMFSLLIYRHNRAISEANSDANKRAELFRDLQFISDNYSIIEFMDRMLISGESERYVERYIKTGESQFHMVLTGMDINDVYLNPEKYEYVTMRTPFRVSEGKIVSKIVLSKLTFERDSHKYQFTSPTESEIEAFLLYNERTKRRNMIINLIVPKNSQFFVPTEISVFSKIKMRVSITSVLGVSISGISELYFTNPEQVEGDGTNTYRINSSSFYVTELPAITSQILSDDHKDML